MENLTGEKVPTVSANLEIMTVRRLSQRMKSVLQLLAERRNNFSMEKAKEHIVGFQRLVTSMKETLGRATSTEKLEPSEEEVTDEYYCLISLRLKDIIIELQSEIKKNYESMVDRRGGEASEEAVRKSPFGGWLRTNVSLPELIIGKLLPKGREAWWSPAKQSRGWRCSDVEGYRQALKTTDKLMASYCRTLTRLLDSGLVGVVPKHKYHEFRSFYITDKGLSVLTHFETLNT